MLEGLKLSRNVSESRPLRHDMFAQFLIKYETQYGHKRGPDEKRLFSPRKLVGFRRNSTAVPIAFLRGHNKKSDIKPIIKANIYTRCCRIKCMSEHYNYMHIIAVNRLFHILMLAPLCFIQIGWGLIFTLPNLNYG